MVAKVKVILSLVVLGAALVGCGGDDGATSTATSTAEASTSGSAPSTSAATTSTSVATTGPAVTLTTPTTTATETTLLAAPKIVVADGKVEGGVQRIEIPSGTLATFAVEADVTDEVHVHGYDETVDISPGEPVTVSFTANIPGVFEVELENAGLLIAELEVQ